MSKISIDDEKEFNDESQYSILPNRFSTRTFSSELQRRPVILKPINKVSEIADIRSIRTGVGNYDIKRMNFMAAQIVGRNAIAFEKQQLLDIQQQGITVKLGDKTLTDLYAVQVPDDTDYLWLREEKIRLIRGESQNSINLSPPFNRPQRTIIKTINHGQQNLNLNTQIGLLLAEVRQNSVESKSDNATITAQLMALCSRVDELQDLTNAQLDSLRLVLRRLNLPTSFEVFFSNTQQTRIVSLEQFNTNIGQIMLFLLNNAVFPLTIDKPIYGISGNPIGIRSVITQLSLPRVNGHRQYYIDLINKRIISRMQAEFLVSVGVDNGELEGITIKEIDVPMEQPDISKLEVIPE